MLRPCTSSRSRRTDATASRSGSQILPVNNSSSRPSQYGEKRPNGSRNRSGWRPKPSPVGSPQEVDRHDGLLVCGAPPNSPPRKARRLPTPLDGWASYHRIDEIVQPIRFDLSLRPITFESAANRRLAGDRALNESDFGPARPNVKMVNNLILHHLNKPSWLQERSNYWQAPVPRFLWRM
jgi:hypothetical protein